MKLHYPVLGLLMLHVSPALAEQVTLPPAALKAISIAGNAGSPTFTLQNVGSSYTIRARDFPLATDAVRGNVVYLRFDLSSLGNIVVQTASLKFNRVAISGTKSDTLTTGRFALFGLKDLAGNLVQNWAAATFAYGAEFDPSMFRDNFASTGVCPINLANVADFSTQETVSTDLATLGSADFVSFLQARADAGGQATVMLTMPSQGPGNDKQITYAFTGYTDPALAAALTLSYSAALPPAPANFSLAGINFAMQPSLTLSWDAVDGAVTYDVYRRAAGETTPTLVYSGTDPSYSDVSVELFGTYYYSVDVVTAKGQSLPSTELEVRVIDLTLGAPAAPTELVATMASPSSIGLAWTAVPQAIYYQLYRATEPDGTFSLLQNVTTTSATDSDNLQGFRSYYYRLKTVSPGGISWFSETLAVEPRFIDAPLPAKPRHVSAPSATLYSIDLSWDASADAQGYYVYRSTHQHGGFTLVGITDTNSLTDTFAVFPQNTYYYVVYAAGAGGFSPPSHVAEVEAFLKNYKQVERLGRAPVALPTPEGVFVSWRLLGTDRPGTSFDVFRDGHRVNHHPLWGATNFLDRSGTASSTYEVREALEAAPWRDSETARSLPSGYLGVPIQPPPDGVTPAGDAYSYAANDASAADLDGDGVYEIILKWDPTNSQDNANAGYTGNVFIDAYKLDGTRLWRVDLGRNIRAGAHYTQFLVYDFDGDGRAEMMCKTADGTVDGQGGVIGDPEADYRDSTGRVLAGPEFLTVFEGVTGIALDTVDYIPPRGNVTDWGDSYGNRVDRFNAGVAYLDGTHPSAFFERGYYRGQSGSGAGITVVAAFGLSEGRLVNRWVFDTRVAGSAYIGQGNHQVASGDVDGDGKDEVVLGSLVLNDDGTVLYSTNLGHGDAMHLGDLDPTHPGLELFSVKEEAAQPYQDAFTDAATGTILWGVSNGKDTGRGLVADIDPNYAGEEAWGASNVSVWSAKGALIGRNRPSINFAIWWDGDPLRELLDDVSVRKWDWVNRREIVLLDAVGAASNNGSKATPCLQADLLGDWREEVVLRSADNTELRIYTTSAVTEQRIPTLMHDPQYRAAVATQNSGYNQPPQPSFFIGNNMPAAPIPKVFVRPVPELLGMQDSDGNYHTPVWVSLEVNSGEFLRNECSVDDGAWTPYSHPFMVTGRGEHEVACRTLDIGGNVLAETSQTVTIEHPWPRHHGKHHHK